MANRIKELENEIKKNQELYYNGNEVISDGEFDALVDELQSLDPENPLLTTLIGADHTEGFATIEHRILMGSQSKANTETEMNNWISTINPKKVLGGFKMDGSSLEIWYDDGVYTKAVTRGDGKTGDDVTENVRKMNYVPKKLKEKYTGVVRGEVLLSRKNFEKYFKGKYKNCRNTATGVMKRIDGSDCDKLDVVVYDAQYLDNNKEFGTQEKLVNFFEKNGFKVAEYKFFDNLTGKKAMDYLKEIFDKFDDLEYDIDGIVWKQNEIDMNDMRTNARPKTNIALKPAKVYKQTKLVNIEWQVRNGSITPVVDVPFEYKSHEDYLHYLVFQTFEEKFGWMSKEEQEIRRERLERELPVINALDYTDYFIMLYMIAKEADKRGLPRGYSRGSGANCLCLFMLNVTQVDSVRWALDFSRFANMGRIGSLADFDWDISKRRRKEIIEITEELFGKENVAPIATFNTLSTKVAIKDIGKVLNEKESSPYFGQIPYSIRDEVAKMIPTVKTLDDLGEEVEKEETLQNVLSVNPKMTAVYQQFPKWFSAVLQLEGLPKSMGRHAAGTIISPRPVVEYAPLCRDKEGNSMLQIEMHGAMDDLSLIKM